MKKSIALCLLCPAIFALVLFAGAVAAHAAITTAPSEIRAGYTATFVAAPASIYIWEFPMGEPRTAFTREVTWKAPSATASTPVVITVKLTADGVLDTSGLTIFSRLQIRNKTKISQIILYGESSLDSDGQPAVLVAGGDPSHYSWTVTGPLDKDPNHDYDYAGYSRVSNNFVFVAPSEGLFSGRYTVTVSDGLPDTDFVNFYVPPHLDVPYFVFPENRPPFFVVLKGAPDGATYTPVLLDGGGKTANEVTDDPAQYGTFTVPGPSDGGLLTATYTPPPNLGTPIPFWFGMQPQNVELMWDDVYNIYEPVSQGAIYIRKMGTFAGTVLGPDEATPIAGAKVDILAPKPFIQTTLTNGAGGFSFFLPKSSKYYFSVSAPGYVERTFTSTLLPNEAAADNPVVLQPMAANAYIEGTVSAEGLPLTNATEVKVALLYHDAFDIPVFVRDTHVAGGQFRISFPENLPARNYSLIAYNAGYYARHDLPPASSVPPPYVGVNLDMARIADLPPTLLLPLTAGYTMNINDTEGVLGAIVELPAGCLKVGNLIQPPTPPEVAASGDIRQGLRSDPFVAASDTVLKFLVGDQAPGANTEHNSELINERGMYISLPFDLTYVKEGDLEVNNIKIRYSAVNLTDLQGCSAIVVPQEDILAFDYLGDGTTGWVTFWVPEGDWFGVGNPCNPADSSGKYKGWPTFERYEFYGCFIQALPAR